MMHGQVSLAISLPSKWVKMHGLKKGEEVELQEDEGKLVVIPEGVSEESKKTEVALSLDTFSFVRTMISNSYKKGFDTIKINYTDKKFIPLIHEVVTNLTGLELVDSGANYEIAQVISEENQQQLDTLTRRTFLLIKQMLELLLEDISLSKYENREQINQMRINLTRITDFCKRALRKFKKHEENTTFIYLIIWSLEKISNEIYYLYNVLAENKPKTVSKDAAEFAANVKELFSRYYDSFYAKDIKMLEEVSMQKDKLLFQDLQKMLLKSIKTDSFILHHTANIARRIQDMVGPSVGYWTD